MKKKVLIRLFRFLARLLLFFYVLPASIFYFYAAWGLIAAILIFFFLPLGVLIYPFLILIHGLGGWPEFVFNLIIVIIVLAMTMTVRKWSEEYKVEEATIVEETGFKIRIETILNDVKQFIKWLLLIWTEFIGFSILLPFSVIFVFVGPLRQLLFIISLRSKMWSRDFKDFFTVMLLFFYLQIAIAAPGMAYEYFGIDRILDGIVVAGLLLTFTAFQFQRMTPPYFEATFLPSLGDSYEDVPRSIVKANVDTKALLFVRITNLGLATFKDCVFSVVFPEGFEIIEDTRLYSGIDFEKKFSLQRKNRCIQFLPNDNYITFPPCNHLVFPIWVNTPKKTGKYKISCSLSSESAWGEEKRELLQIDITND